MRVRLVGGACHIPYTSILRSTGRIPMALSARAYCAQSNNDGGYSGNYWDQQYEERVGKPTHPLPSLPSPVGNTASAHSDSLTLTHTDAEGKGRMVDVSHKCPTVRIARATATVYLGEKAYGLTKLNQHAKGDVLAVARIAGISGAKKTSDLIPLCHNIALSQVSVDFAMDDATHSVTISSHAKTVGVTGVEMEALTAATISALTIYDMCKAVSHAISIGHIRLCHKSGGKSDSDYNG